MQLAEGSQITSPDQLELTPKKIKKKIKTCKINNQKVYSIVSINIGSAFKKKVPQIREVCQNDNMDILFLNEASLMQIDTLKLQNCFQGYNLFPKEGQINTNEKTGVCALINDRIIADVKGSKLMMHNRLLHLKMDNEQQEWNIMGVYAPAKREEKESFWKELCKYIHTIKQKVCIIGDINAQLNPEIDNIAAPPKNHSGIQALDSAIVEGLLHCMFRALHPRSRKYSFYRIIKNGGIQQTRIDTVLANDQAYQEILEVDLGVAVPVLSPDHKAIAAVIKVGEGRPCDFFIPPSKDWRIARESLKSDKVIDKLQQEIKSWSNQSEQKWNELYQESKIQELYNMWEEAILNKARESCGTKVSCRNQPRPNKILTGKQLALQRLTNAILAFKQSQKREQWAQVIHKVQLNPFEWRPRIVPEIENQEEAQIWFKEVKKLKNTWENA